MLTIFIAPQHGWTIPASPQFIKNTAHAHRKQHRATQNYTPHQKQPYHTKRLSVLVNRPMMLAMVRRLPMRTVGIYGKWRITRTLLINLDDHQLRFLPHKKRQVPTRRIFAVGSQGISTPSFATQNYQKLPTAIIYNPFIDKPYRISTFLAHFRLMKQPALT